MRTEGGKNKKHIQSDTKARREREKKEVRNGEVEKRQEGYVKMKMKETIKEVRKNKEQGQVTYSVYSSPPCTIEA